MTCRIGVGLRSLTGQWYLPCDGGHLQVFEIRLDGLDNSIPSCSVQQKLGGGAVGLWWICPVGRILFACLCRTPSSCTNFGPVIDHPPLQRRPTQRQGYERYLLRRKAHMSQILLLW